MQVSNPVVALVGLALVIALSPLVLIALARHRVYDTPNERSSHDAPTPRGGGIAVSIAVLIGISIADGPWGTQRIGLLAVAAALGVVGVVEDLRGIPATRRLLLQALIAAVCAPLLVHRHGGVGALQLLAFIAAVVWLVAYTNAFNFMDGVNGISSGQVVVAGVAYLVLARGHDALVVTAGAAVTGAALGFLPFNFPKARMFLGDVGSYFLGGLLAALAVVSLDAGVGLVPALAPLALYGADTGVTLCRRVLRGEVWHEAHHSHTYQQLVDAGWNHPAVTALVTGVAAVCSAIGLAVRHGDAARQTAAAGAIGALLIAYLLSPTLFRRLGRGEAVPA